MSISLPRINFSADDRPAAPVAAYEVNAAQRTGGNRGSLGTSIQLPLEPVRALVGVPLLVWGTLSWNSEHEGIAIPAQSVSRMTIPAMLSIPITDEQITRIETKRAGGPALFDLRLKSLVLVDGNVASCTSDNFPTLIVIPLDEWIKILAMLGYGERRLIELPPAPAAKSAEWRDALKQIAAASQRLAKGDAGAAIGEVRIAMDRLVEGLGVELGRPRADKEPSKNYFAVIAGEVRKLHLARSDDPYEVLARTIELASAIHEFSSDPMHNGLTASERSDAELAITTASALYSYVVRARFPLP